MPPSVLLYNNVQGFEDYDPSSLFLRLLFSWGRITTFGSLLEGCRNNWTAQNIIELAKTMIIREDWDFLERMLDMSTVIQIF